MYGAFGEDNEYLILPTQTEEGENPQTIETECGLLISPVASADVILTGPDGVRVVFDAVYGRLPNGVVVVAVIDNEDVFPANDDELDLKITLDPFIAEDDFHEVDHVTAVALVSDHCELCGFDCGGDLEEGDDTDLDPETDIEELDDDK